MKQVKKFLYLLGMAAAIIVVVFACTAIVQFGMMAVSENMGVAMAEDMIYHVSGSLGVAAAGLLCAVYAKKKNYTKCVETEEAFNLVKP